MAIYTTALRQCRRVVQNSWSDAILKVVPQATTIPEIDIELDLDVLSQVRQLRPHKVVVLDCQCHTFDDVEQALCRVIPAMTRPKAHAHAWEIHSSGASVVATAPQELAEHFGAQLSRYGLRVSVEPDV